MKKDMNPDRTGQTPVSSGLEPKFPDGFQCIEISSPFGSPTRYDGSKRPKNRYGGRHGGIDLSLGEGTPLLSIANGTVVLKGEGEQMEGNYIWTRHSPEDTGLPYWVYAKYQHLESVPEIEAGDKIIMGQVIAHSGKTGTTGGHYGFNGYPHLHLSILKSPHGNIRPKSSKGLPSDATLIDAVEFYRDANRASGLINTSSSSDRTVMIPVLSGDGRFLPRMTKVIWPVVCESNE